jgi:hypothetical protein
MATDGAVDVGTSVGELGGEPVVRAAEDPDVCCIAFTSPRARLDVIALEPRARVTLDAGTTPEAAAQAVSLENRTPGRSRNVW